MDALLSDSEMTNWASWKRASEKVMRDVAAEIAAATGLSAADFSVLTRLVEDGGGALRQQRMADELGWERSRLSRHLGRMEARDLVVRHGSGPERWIDATDTGTGLVTRARRAHAQAVRRHLIEVIPAGNRVEFWATISEISDPGAEN